MTKEELAQRLNGREYGSEITEEEEQDAKAGGLVVVFGYSDDNMELRGSITDEVPCWGGKEFRIDAEGVCPEWDEDSYSAKAKDDAREYFRREHSGKPLTAIWGKDGYSWTYSTEIPHATFDIFDDGEKYCSGIVFDVDEAFREWTPIPAYGMHAPMPIPDWVLGGDGSCYLATKTHYTHEEPSRGDNPKWATHYVYFGK